MSTDAGPWPMHAHERDGGFQHFGSRQWVELHGLPDAIAEVSVSEAAPGTADDDAYWGWIWSPDERYPGRTSVPTMIWRRRLAFDAQFTYGPEAEAERGKGRVVRLAVRKIEAEDTDEH